MPLIYAGKVGPAMAQNSTPGKPRFLVRSSVGMLRLDARRNMGSDELSIADALPVQDAGCSSAASDPASSALGVCRPASLLFKRFSGCYGIKGFALDGLPLQAQNMFPPPQRASRGATQSGSKGLQTPDMLCPDHAGAQRHPFLFHRPCSTLFSVAESVEHNSATESHNGADVTKNKCFHEDKRHAPGRTTFLHISPPSHGSPFTLSSTSAGRRVKD